MNQAAAIKRASRQARLAMQQLDQQSAEQLLALYERAAEEVRAEIRAAADAGDQVATHRLRRLLEQIDTVVERLGQDRDALLRASIDEAARLGVRPFTTQGLAAAGGHEAVVTSTVESGIHQAAVDFVLRQRQADGLTLSERVWRLNQDAKETLHRSIARAVIRGDSAARAAQELMSRGQAVPPATQQLQREGRGGQVAKLADLLVEGDGSERWKAERVLRTEINRAHGEAFMATGERTPGFAGWRYLLSPAHPGPDICLRAGSLVTLARGEVPIEQVRLDDLALTHKGRWRPVTRLYQHQVPAQPLVRLRFRAGNSRTQELVLTGNHPVLTLRGWVRADALQTGWSVACRRPAPGRDHPAPAHGAACTAQPGSGGTASGGAAESACPAPRDTRCHPCHTPHSPAPSALPSTPTPIAGAARSLPSCCPPATPGCPGPCAGPIAQGAPRPCVETCSDAACHSWGWPHRARAHTPDGNNAARANTSGILGRTLRTFSAWWRGLAGSTPGCRSAATAAADAGPPARPRRTHGTAPPSAPSAPPLRTGDCKSAWWWIACLVPTVPAWAEAVRRRFGRGQKDASSDFALSWEHPIIDRVHSAGETVYNIAVEEDTSYVAQGVVVHNCDLLATQNVHGLGEGVYPTRERTPWPAHPNTLSFLEIVFEAEVTDADRAGKETELQALQRLAPEIRAGALGVGKAKYFDAGLLTKGMIRANLGAVEERLQRQGRV